MLDPTDGRIFVTTDRVMRSRQLIDRSSAVLALTQAYAARTSELLRQSTDRLALASSDWGEDVGPAVRRPR